MMTGSITGRVLVTKEDFRRYLVVQKSGQVNMWDSRVCQLGNLTREQHLYIIKNYSSLVKEYGISIDDVDVAI